jgi:hypothetical protein
MKLRLLVLVLVALAGANAADARDDRSDVVLPVAASAGSGD